MIGHLLKLYVEGMVEKYYRLMSWNEKTGKHYRATLERVVLDDVLRDL